LDNILSFSELRCRKQLWFRSGNCSPVKFKQIVLEAGMCYKNLFYRIVAVFFLFLG